MRENACKQIHALTLYTSVFWECDM